MDAGINSICCETFANIIASLASISVRGRLLSQLRKVRKTLRSAHWCWNPLCSLTGCHPSISKFARSLSDNPVWGEVSVLLCLTLIAGIPVLAACSQSAACHRSCPYCGSGSGLGLHYCLENGLWNHYEPFAGALFCSGSHWRRSSVRDFATDYRMRLRLQPYCIGYC